MKIENTKLTFPCSFAPDKDDRTVKAIISTDTVNRYGFILKSSGMQNDNYRKNPVVLFNHNDDWIIGKSLYEDISGDKIIALPRLNTTPKGNEVHDLIQSGDINALSVSFDPIEIDESGEIPIVTKWDLNEYSFVAVPANPEALRLSYDKIKDPDIKKYFKLHLDKHQKEMEITELSNIVEELKNKLTGIETTLNAFNTRFEEFEALKLKNDKSEENLNMLIDKTNKLSLETQELRIQNKVIQGLI